MLLNSLCYYFMLYQLLFLLSSFNYLSYVFPVIFSILFYSFILSLIDSDAASSFEEYNYHLILLFCFAVISLQESDFLLILFKFIYRYFDIDNDYLKFSVGFIYIFLLILICCHYQICF